MQCTLDVQILHAPPTTTVQATQPAVGWSGATSPPFEWKLRHDEGVAGIFLQVVRRIPIGYFAKSRTNISKSNDGA
jgi:hypothetical protein